MTALLHKTSPADYADLIGTTATGRCVTSGLTYTGTIAEVLIPTNQPSDVRYRLTGTGIFYSHGGPVEPIIGGTARYNL